ncbi:UBE2O enzyme, partial [Polypterus senegalus]
MTSHTVPSYRIPAHYSPHSLTTAAMADPGVAAAVASTPSGELVSLPGGSQRLLFSHDLVSGRYRGSVRFGLVRLIHGEEDSDSDSDAGGGAPGSGAGGGAGAGSSDTESVPKDSRARPLGRGYVRVQWYPEGCKQDIRETKVKGTAVWVCSPISPSGALNPEKQPNEDRRSALWRPAKPEGAGLSLKVEAGPGLRNLSGLLGARDDSSSATGERSRCNSKECIMYRHNCSGNVREFSEMRTGLGVAATRRPAVLMKPRTMENGGPVLCSQLKLEDRSVVPRDMVRRMYPCDGQCGTVIDINIECAVKIVGTNCVLYPVNSRDLQHIWPFMYGDYIAYDCWLGKVYDLKNHVILKLSNGARCSMNTEDGAKLYDMCPHVSDSGLFFDDSYGFYPGQVLIGPSKVFSNVQWLSGVKPVLSKKSKFRVVVEEVQVVELKVTWITKSFCPGGTESVFPPPSIITQDNLSRVKRLGYYDHAQRQLGERCLYVFPAKGDTTQITCEGPEGATILPEGSVAKKVRRLLKKEIVRKMGSVTDGQTTNEQPTADCAAAAESQSAVEVVSTKTSADVMWQDGTVETNIRSNELLPIHHLDNNEFCPGDFVVDKRPQALQDPNVYGVVQSGDHRGRTCAVKWVKLQPTGVDVEVIREEEDVSVYDIADHPDFHFRTNDIVIRIGSTGEARAAEEDSEPSVGQVSRVDVSSKVEVVWADNSRTIVLPQHLYNVESEIEESDYDSVEGSSSAASSEEWEDESDSWETDNGQVEEEHAGETAPASTPAAPADEGKSLPSVDEPQGAEATAGASGAEKQPKDGTPRSFRELKEAIKILESLKNMTVEQLLTGSPTSPTVESEKQTKEKKFLDDIKKLQENLKKTLDNVAIVEEEKMEAVAEVEKEEKNPEPHTPVKSEWPSDTPVLCQQSGGKPGVIFTSAKGEVFSVLEWALDSHSFKKMEFQPAEPKKFFSTVRKEMALLATSLPDGIMVKTFEDRMDLFSALIKGPTRTPYEDGLFLFDIQLPNIYPAVPPLFRYLSQCSGRLNPNLYDNGKVCVSLLGTWIGKGTERWTSKSSLLQVLISIQGLILVNEPYYNEAGFDSDRGLQEGYENSRCYNEMALIKVVQSMTQLLLRPVEVFQQEIREHFSTNGWRLVHRIEYWLELNDMVDRREMRTPERPLSAEPGDELVASAATSLDNREEVLEDSGLGTSTISALEAGQHSDSEATGVLKAVTVVADDQKVPVDSVGSQISVKPKKRRKSYRSFLPEKSGYPDIGFPLFPLSKGFIKSIRGVIQHYRAALTTAGFPERAEEK